MNDCISRSALLKELDPYCNPYIDDYGKGYVAGISTAISHIEDAPAVTPEVPHGRWERYKLPSGTHAIRCSRCKERNGMAKPYCPNCGVRMDGDGNG